MQEPLKLRLIHISLYVFLVMALIGLFDSMYLAYAYATNTPLSCGAIPGCNEVMRSPYTNIAGISLPVLGIIYYSFSLWNFFVYFIWRNTFGATLLAYLGTLGFLASVYFLYVQVELIKAICIYCVISALTATIMFFISMFIRLHHINHHDRVSV